MQEQKQAGTTINRRTATPIYGPDGQCRSSIHGYFDPSSGVFQGAGDRNAILNTTVDPPLMSCHEDVWRFMLHPANGVRVWEMIDKPRNEVYRIEVSKARQVARQYWTRCGQRWGVPVHFCDLLDADGDTIRAGLPVPSTQLEFGNLAHIRKARGKR